jgi:hypothetical protein
MLGNYREIRKRETQNSWQEVCNKLGPKGCGPINTV